jgi:type IV pilus assembly protein PilN
VIEVNLLPGGRKRQSRKRSVSMPTLSVKGLPSDRWVQAALFAGLVAVGAMAWFWFSLQQQEEEVAVAVEAAVQDSARFADLIERTRRLQARRDSIVERVAVIQEIDQNRYVWPHVLDQVARALPDYTWLTQIGESGTNPLRIMLRGRAGNNYAVTVFMDQLEASDYFRGVDLISTEQAPASIEGGGMQVVYAFELQMTFEQPPLESLETVPLLGAESGAGGR